LAHCNKGTIKTIQLVPKGLFLKHAEEENRQGLAKQRSSGKRLLKPRRKQSQKDHHLALLCFTNHQSLELKRLHSDLLFTYKLVFGI